MWQVAGIGAALLSSCLVPAGAMAALSSSATIGCSVFVMTFGMAVAHAVLLGLPLFLIFWSKGWVNAATCIIAGFAIGAGPTAISSWPPLNPQFTTPAPMMIDAAAQLAGWIGYFTPPMYLGIFGALGGIAFWLVLRSCHAACISKRIDHG